MLLQFVIKRKNEDNYFNNFLITPLYSLYFTPFTPVFYPRVFYPRVFYPCILPLLISNVFV